jgi:hypothetical protein
MIWVLIEEILEGIIATLRQREMNGE